MEACSEGHEEIVHNNYRGCPVCQLISEHQEEIQSKLREIEQLEDARDALEQRLEGLE